MKLLREYIRKVLQESASPSFETVGDLKKAIKAASSSKKDAQGKEALKDLGKSIFADLFPGGGTISSLFDLVKNTYTMDDNARTGTALDYLDVDDDVSAIVDDPIENKFVEAVSKAISDKPDDTRLDTCDMTKLLSKYISGEFNDRTVIGFDD